MSTRPARILLAITGSGVVLAGLAGCGGSGGGGSARGRPAAMSTAPPVASTTSSTVDPARARALSLLLIASDVPRLWPVTGAGMVLPFDDCQPDGTPHGRIDRGPTSVTAAFRPPGEDTEVGTTAVILDPPTAHAAIVQLATPTVASCLRRSALEVLSDPSGAKAEVTVTVDHPRVPAGVEATRLALAIRLPSGIVTYRRTLLHKHDALVELDQRILGPATVAEANRVLDLVTARIAG